VQGTLGEAIQEVTEWARENPSELVLLYLSHCDGPDCIAHTTHTLQAASVASVSEDCDELRSLTLHAARRRARRADGGRVLALWECVEENWDQNVSCYHTVEQGGAEPPQPCCCYDSDTAAAPFEALWKHLRTVVGQTHADDKLWMLQVDASSSARVVIADRPPDTLSMHLCTSALQWLSAGSSGK
jgi:hypothetical protein